MADYRITTQNAIPPSSEEDCYLADNDPIHRLKALAGLGGLGFRNNPTWTEYTGSKFQQR